MAVSIEPPVEGHAADIAADGEFMRCVGAWTLDGIEGLEQRLAQRRWPDGEILLDGSGCQALDTAGALLLSKTVAELLRQGRAVRLIDMRTEHQTLLNLVAEHGASAPAVPPPAREGILVALGKLSWRHVRQGLELLAFIGEAAIALGHTLLQPRRIRWQALLANIEAAGLNALPIVGLLAFLIGVVIAYQGGVQLSYYGANIFIVELVSLTMLRELAPLITAVIVAGRTGSAYTAQIGTMTVTEEVDALRTIGIAPMELLVLPKLLALIIALPLLTVFADALSLLGGMVMAQFLLNVSFIEFLNRIPQVVTAASFLVGVVKTPVFAAIIALVGCYQGFQVRGGADSVGRQTTVSVVQAIFLVIVADAIFSVFLGTVGL